MSTLCSRHQVQRVKVAVPLRVKAFFELQRRATCEVVKMPSRAAQM